MSNNLEINIKTATTGSEKVDALKQKIESLGNIQAFKKLKEDVQDSKSAWEKATKKVADLAKEMRAAGTPTKKLSNEFKKAKTQAANLKQSFQKNQKQLHLMRGSLNTAGISTKNLRGEYKRLQRQIADETGIRAARKLLNVRPYKDIQHEIKRMKQAYVLLKRSGKLSMSELYRAEMQLREGTRELEAQTNGWAESIAGARAGLASLAAIGYAAVKSFTGYSEFTQKMTEVSTLVDVSKDKLAGYSQQLIDMSTRIPQTASELASAEYDIISAGVKLGDSTRVLELAAKAAIAGVTDTKTAATTGMSVINAYGKSTSELSDVYNTLFKTIKLGVTTFPELSESIGEVLPTARAAGVGFKDVAAAIASMTKAGIKTPEAVTALKGAINSLAAPTAEAKKEMKALGITWKGLIPTLEAISKEGLSIDRMRMLIPNVRARTGVLALTQNIDRLKQTLVDIKNPTEVYLKEYEKMKDTPANQIKLFKNEITKLTIQMGKFLATGLLPVLKATGFLIDKFGELDPVTKGLVTVLAGAGPAMLIWHMGLSSIVFGLKGAAIAAVEATQKILAFEAASISASLALKGTLVGITIYAGYEVLKLGKTMYGAAKAADEATKAQKRLYDTCDRLIKKFAEFKDVKMPDDILGRAPEEIEEFKKNLLKSKAYYVALQVKLSEKSKKTTLFGSMTKEAVAAQKQLKTVNQHLNEINADLKKLKQAGIEAGKGMTAPVKAVKATAKQLDSFEAQAKKAYQNASAEAKKYGQQVIAWEEKIKYARLSTADKIRELGRKGLTEELQWDDKKLEAEEKLSAAKQAFANGDYKLAEKLAKDSEGLYADLATKVEKQENGKTVVVESLEDTKEIATNGIQTVGNFINQLYTKQKDNAEKSKNTWQNTATKIQNQLDEITQDRQAKIDISLEGVQSAADAINDLTKDETKHITIQVTKEVSTVEKKQSGGIAGEDTPVRASTGAFIRRAGSLPGFGGGDKIPALLEAGEWIIRKEAVQKYGSAFMAKLNAGLLSNLPKFSIGGAIGSLSEADLERYKKYKELAKEINDIGGYLEWVYSSEIGQGVSGTASDIYKPHNTASPDFTMLKSLEEFFKHSKIAKSSPSKTEGMLLKLSEAVAEYKTLGGSADYNRLFELAKLQSDGTKRTTQEQQYAEMLASTFGDIKATTQGDLSSGYADWQKKQQTDYEVRLQDALNVPSNLRDVTLGGMKSLAGSVKSGLSSALSGLSGKIPQMSIPTSLSEYLSKAGGRASGSVSTVKHSVDLSFGGKSFGPLTGDTSTILDFVHELEMAKLQA